MRKISNGLRFILIDAAGILLIILAGLTGWIPGPGGIPLLIAGLGLLSVNHEWAKRWLQSAQKHGVHLSDKLFNGSRMTTLVVDFIGIALLAGAVLVLIVLTGNIAKSAAIWLIIVSLVLLLGNRQRLKKLFRR